MENYVEIVENYPAKPAFMGNLWKTLWETYGKTYGKLPFYRIRQKREKKKKEPKKKLKRKDFI
jgi:hypothetical protein